MPPGVRDSRYRPGMWPLLVKDADLTFVDDPPEEIGEVVGAWTNNSKRGIKPVPLSLRLLIARFWLLLGLAVGLVAFFVIGGIYEHRGGHIEASWFLDALAVGGLVGVLVSLPAALRKPKILTLFVGKDGYYWFGTLRDLCPEGKTLSWANQYAMVNAIQAHENATAEEDEMKPQVPSAANIAALSKLLADPI